MKQPSLIITPLCSIPLIKPGDDIPLIIWQGLQDEKISLQSGDIIIVTQKIISKAEGRIFNLEKLSPSKLAVEIAKLSHKDPRFVELILHESNEILRVTPEVIIVEHRLGFICANAGIDQSNVDPQAENGLAHHYVLLLPINPDQSAAKIRAFLEEMSNTRIAVLIIDTQGRAWRLGVVGMTIGLSGVSPLIDMRGKNDLFGIPLKITLIAAVDELAAAASLMMGQADEGRPVVHVRGFPYPLQEGKFAALLRHKETDMFR